MNQAKDKYLRRTYGISLRTFKHMLTVQKGVCWICKNPPKSRALNVDHRHVPNYTKLTDKEKRKEVRGLLCFRCNVTIGKIEKSKNSRLLLSGIVEYFKRYPMRDD